MRKDNHFANERTLPVLLDWTLLTLSALTTAILFAWLLAYSGYGLNLVDEGYWLNYISNPFAHAINIPPSLFGFIYHWPYQWARGDIAVLRTANVTLTMALGWILSFLVIRRLWMVRWPHAAVLSAGMASLILVGFYYSLLLTPSYYTLTVQSVLMVMIGLLVTDHSGCMRQISGWTLVSLGGWSCFMARPTTAAAMILIVMLYVVVLRPKSVLHMLGAALIAASLLMATAYLIDGGITGLVTRMINSAALEVLLGAGHEMSLMFRIDWLPTSRSQLATAALMATALLLSTLTCTTHKSLSSLALAAVLIVTIAIALWGANPVSIEPSTLFLVPAFTCLGVTFYREGRVLRTHARTSIVLALIFVLLPHLTALGSNGNYWAIGSTAAVFWMLAMVAFLSPLAQEGRGVATLLPVTVWAQFLTASVVNAGMVKPFWQVKDLRAYTAIMPVPGGGKLVLSQRFRDYLTTARTQARAAGLHVGTPVIDLSHSPTLLYVLETRPLGLPWLIGGFPGSNRVAMEALGLENCTDLANAWVLIAPEGRRHLDQTGAIASIGAKLADYAAAAMFETPPYEGVFVQSVTKPPTPIRPERQYLLKPVRPVPLAQQSCREARRQRLDSQNWSHW